jgi:MFS family permease
LNKIAATYKEFPQAFWTLIGVTFIDRLGGAMLYPFFTLYITKKFEVGMTEVGILFALFSISGFIGSTLGGALSDRMGRKGMLIFSLISSSLSSVAMGLVNSLGVFFILALVVGIFTDIGGPANQAIVADLLPERKRAQGYGMIRVAFNVSAAVGPAIGGFIAARSYLALFIADAIISLITAIIVSVALPETKPETQEGAVGQESMGNTFAGYFKVLQDKLYILFLGASLLSSLVYMNMNVTMGPYLRDTHHIPESGYGFILSMNAAMVVLMQFWVTRRIENKPPFLMMTAGTLLYAIGFGMYGFTPLGGEITLWGITLTGVYAWFLFAMIVITIGEMIVAPVSQSLVARFAPEDMRGRYMAVFGYSWAIPFAIGPLLAGQVMDNFDPRILWYIAGLIGLLATAGFLRLHQVVPSQLTETAQANPDVAM